MNETKRLDVSDIDFESIRDNLKDFLRSQDTLQDYDFEGSAVSSLVNLLSYVTHYNAVNANLGLNETFLDTAQFRGSVVGHARQLGYTPRSATSAGAVVDITVADAPAGERLVIPRGHKFRAKIDNTSYTFITLDEFASTTGSFQNIPIQQVALNTAEYIFDAESNEKYLIPNENADTSTLLVRVFDSQTSLTSTPFIPARSLTTIEPDSNVYFITENPDGLFEITFGDGILGTQLENGNVINIEFGVTQKGAANGARIFTSVDSISGFSDITVSTVNSARGGSEKESIESIKYLAPLSYAAQNRAVTSRDYEAIVRESFANLRSIKAWGGEENDPPAYGKVFISVNPKNTEFLTNEEKEFITDTIISPKNVATITPEIIDPAFLYITFEVFFKYDPSLTNLSKNALESNVTEDIREFSNIELNEFDSVFRYSNFLRTVDNSDESILNSFARVYISRRFVPTLSEKRTYTLDYSVDLFESFGTRPVIRSSSRFSIDGADNCRFTDILNNDGTREVIVVSGTEGNESVVKRRVGTIERNKIILTDFVPTDFEGTMISIEAIPNSYDIAGAFNTILMVDCRCDRYSVEGYVDTIITGEDDSGANYRTFDKNE